jgi:fibronectin-binding autotransporter adhesin
VQHRELLGPVLAGWDPLGDGRIDTTIYGFGATLTWYGDYGFYVDAQGQLSGYDSDVVSHTLNQTLADGNAGVGYALSLEAGQRFELGSEWSLTPQAQLTYSRIRFDEFTDPNGAQVSLDRAASLQGRLGLAAEYATSWQNEADQTHRVNLYGIANLYGEFLNGARVTVSGISIENRNERVWGGVGVGGSYNWDDDRYSLYGEVSANTSLRNFGDSYSIGGNVGFRMRW